MQPPLTTDQLAAFVGGNMEIQNLRDNTIHRGRIEFISIKGTNVVVRFQWVAKNDGGPKDIKSTWTNYHGLEYVVSLKLYTPFVFSNGCICLSSRTTDEQAMLIPADGMSRIDPARVKGLRVYSAIVDRAA